ncbi:hypothetical protein CSA17_06150 [bacterium DOLJORAL78_65_58]|nr:MAG: hypothetical protein CSB20_02050 [bacterium DOLZORAL124_64_63]PIE75694.1 MAG: hypothetical protein CSA17_06150 [bacterium DOLJORAL78_65_58]
MRYPITWAVSSLVILVIIATGGFALADPADDYAKAQAKSRELARSLQSYAITSALVLENNVKGQTGGMMLEVSQVAQARMPNRLKVAIESDMMSQQLGTGPSASWFMTSGTEGCYVGAPVTLTRNLEPSEGRELSEENLYNFYIGLEDFLFIEDRTPRCEVTQETLSVGGREVDCQVFEFAAETGVSRFWFDPAVGLILKARLASEISERGMVVERVLTTTVQSYQLNPAIDDDVFTFTAPRGARVVDTLERVMNPDSMVGQTAPDITFQLLDGSTLELKDLRGKTVFIDFWATWCGPCKREMPHIETLYQEFKDDPNLYIIGASNEAQATVQRFIKVNNYHFPIALVDNLERSRFKISGIPAGFVIDPEGIIRAHMVGLQNEEQLRSAFRKGGFDRAR